MKRPLLTLIGCLGALLGLALLLDFVSNAFGQLIPIPPCDDTYASNSVGSCGRPDGDYYDCSSANGAQASCTNENIEYIDVKEDFPTDCTYLKGTATNCNRPDKDCWRRVKCMYDEDTNKCTIDPDASGNFWHQKLKRETKLCPIPDKGS